MKTRILSLIILLLYICNGFNPLHAAENKQEYRFRTLSPEGGFYYDGVMQIQQDAEGFIWIMMRNDLYRFDGYHYKKYGSHFAKLNPSVEWTFVNMTANQSGLFLVNTNNGLYQYDKQKDSFQLVYSPYIDQVKITPNNTLWARKEGKWNRFDLSQQKMHSPLFDGKAQETTLPNFCTHHDNIYLFGDKGEIYRFNNTEQEFHRCFSLPDKHEQIAYVKAHQGKMWILSKAQKLYKIDLASFTIEQETQLFKQQKTIIRSFYLDKNGNIWIGTIKGLYIYHPETKELSHHQASSNPFSLPNNSIWTINEDWQKNVWIGTFSGGLCHVNLNEQIAFKTYFPKENSLNYAPVSAFAEDKESVWIGTEGGGLHRLNKSTQEISYYAGRLKGHRIAYDNVKSIIIDQEQNLWIAMYNGGLDWFNLKNHQAQNFKHQEETNSILDNNIRKLALEPDSGIWIAYQKKELRISYLSFHNKQLQHFQLEKQAKEEYIFDIIRGSGNQLWILTSENLYLLDVKRKEVKKIEQKEQVFMNFHAFCLDDAGKLWIGTRGNGLVSYDPDKQEFQTIPIALDHNILSIYSICFDHAGLLWMGTENGLIKYNLHQNTWANFDTNDGTQGQAYCPLASMKAMNGDLYFGGTSGFTIVHPERIAPNPCQAKVIISDFFINQKSMPFALQDKPENEITLKHNQTNFGFQFSADNYLIPAKNHFKYRLRGYDKHWTEVNASNRTARYSKVPAGVYYFEVLASNNDGVWSKNPTVIKIKRRAAPWASWYAYLLYVTIISSVICLIRRHYLEKKKWRMQLYLENVEKEKKEEIHQAQLRFFTNISHDFRTPLSLIIAALNQLRKEGLREYYFRILNSNSQRLLNLINELMDFRAIENGQINPKIEAINLNELIEKWAADFTDFAKQQKIDYNVEKDPQMPHLVCVDKQILEKIVMNLLHNAFKYTKKGEITIQSYAKADDFQPRFTNKHTVMAQQFPPNAFAIVVRDTGVGISKETISSVFERFYKVNTVNADSHLGTGIGLALVKSLVLQHHGAITIYSERDAGTEIAVYLSLLEGKEQEAEETSEKRENTIIVEKKISEISDLEKLHEEDFKPADKKRILFAEDNTDLRLLISKALQDDYEVLQAADGLEAMKIMDSTTIDLVISDIMMPLKDGVALCHELKNKIETSHIPIILLTAKTSLESKIEGLDSGADVYLEKPVNTHLLQLAIQNIFRHQEKIKAHYANNYFADSSSLSSNEHDQQFLKKLVDTIEENIEHSEMNVNDIASELCMSRSKLYNKVKALTGKSIVEFVLLYRLRKAAKLLLEKQLTIREIISMVGIESQPYFTKSFKKEFGETPTAFVAKYHKKQP